MGELHRDLAAIVENDAGGIGIRAVDNQLDFREPPKPKIVREAAVDLEGGSDLSVINQALQFVRAFNAPDHVEIARSFKTRREFTACHTVVEVIDRSPDMLHVKRYRVAEYQHLKYGHDEDDAAHLRIPEDLQEFLDQHVFKALEHHSSLFLKRRLANSMRAMPNRMSRPASRASTSSPTSLR